MEKKDILTITVCLILLFLWFATRPPLAPPIPPENVDQQSMTQTLDGQNRQTISESKTDPILESSENVAHESQRMPLSNTPSVPPQYADLTSAVPVELTLAEYGSITIDPDKGGITNIELKKFKDRETGKEIVLGNSRHPIMGIENGPQKWTFSRARVVSASRQHVRIARAVVGRPLEIEQTWRVNPDKPYEVGYELLITNNSKDAVTIDGLSMNCGILDPLQTAKGFMGAGGIDQRVDILLSGENDPKTINIDKISGYDTEDRTDLRKWRHDWVAIQNKYFASIVSGTMPFVGCEFFADPIENGKEGSSDQSHLRGNSFLPKANIKAGESREWLFSGFIGPKKYELLKQLDNNKESILQFDLFLFFHFDWMKGISLGILWFLNKLESVFHNYGIAIIITTLVIRTLFWPITHRSTVWSKKMQKIQPQMQELREKYKNDPQKMQQKTMEFYRENKINPVAGCLPVFLQIPVFFALFNVLRSAIELRQAEFLWASDLSRQDSVFIIPGIDIPINPLAILMGLTMVLQQKTMPTSADPMQQKVMFFMTIFFVFMLYPMPSGLTLYWTINQTVSIFQYKVTRHIEGKTV